MNDSYSTFLNNISDPIICCYNSGQVFHLNLKMNNVFEYLNIKYPEHITEIDKEFNYEEILMNNPLSRTIKLKDLSIHVTIFLLKDSSDKENILYLLENVLLSNKTIDNVIELVDEVVVIFNEHGVIEKMNSICDEILPFKRSEAIGFSIFDISKRGLVSNPILIDMLNAKKKIYKNVKYPNGKVIAYTATPYFSSNGNLKGGVLTGRDITRLIKLENQMNFNEHQPNSNDYISKSKIMDNIKQLVIRAASSDSSIFITGESGVGKEIIAKTIYRYSKRREMPFIAINCSAIPSELLESELFGYDEGAFTGAKKGGKMGLLESANGGTVFLDEIGDLPLPLQTKLLRVIQENIITRVGGSKPIEVDIRYISATNISNEELQLGKKFRQDLYYRLSVIPINIPPLRERKEDIFPLVDYFLSFYNEKYDRKIRISEHAMKCLMEYNWPGNIRELKNIIERLVVLSSKETITEDEFNIYMNINRITHSDDASPTVSIKGYTNLNDVYRVVEQIMISESVHKNGSISKASKELGIDQSTIHRKLKSGQIHL